MPPRSAMNLQFPQNVSNSPRSSWGQIILSSRLVLFPNTFTILVAWLSGLKYNTGPRIPKYRSADSKQIPWAQLKTFEKCRREGDGGEEWEEGEGGEGRQGGEGGELWEGGEGGKGGEEGGICICMRKAQLWIVASVGPIPELIYWYQYPVSVSVLLWLYSIGFIKKSMIGQTLIVAHIIQHIKE